MPTYFHFHSNDGEHVFNAPLQCMQCTAMTKNGARCRRRTCIGLPMCRAHLKSELKVEIRPSSIPQAGMGLFVASKEHEDGAVVFKRGDRIVPYHGEIIDDDEVTRRYEGFTAPYGLEIKRNRIEDGALKRGIGTPPTTTLCAKMSPLLSTIELAQRRSRP